MLMPGHLDRVLLFPPHSQFYLLLPYTARVVFISTDSD